MPGVAFIEANSSSCLLAMLNFVYPRVRQKSVHKVLYSKCNCTAMVKWCKERYMGVNV